MRRILVCLSALFFAATTLPVAEGAGDFSILHTFGSPDSDGVCPNGGLTLIGSTIYGTTWMGGEYGGIGGSVFKINSDGSNYEILHSFSLGDVGYNPTSGLVYDGSYLYGTTSKGPYNTCGGTVYRINTEGSFDVMHEFYYPSSSSGDRKSRLALIGSTLYGTTMYSGDYGKGMIYSLGVDEDGFSVLHSFSSGEAFLWGACPLIAFGSTLYGTTDQGGDNGHGTIYKIDADGNGYEILHSFDGDDGSSPASFGGGLQLIGSTLYGATEIGGEYDVGTIFKIGIDGSDFAVLHSFGGSDGDNPGAALAVIDSTLYGKTLKGGENDSGVIFQIDADGTGFDVLYSFATDEADPIITCAGGLITDGSKLYGVSRYAGSNGLGTLYSFTIPEPSTFILLGTAFLGLLTTGCWRRRWKRIRTCFGM